MGHSEDHLSVTSKCKSPETFVLAKTRFGDGPATTPRDVIQMAEWQVDWRTRK